MLSEDAIDNLVQPIVERQEAINLYVILKIARAIKEIGEIIPSDVYKLERILKAGADVREINKELARLTKLQIEDIKSLIKTAAADSYLETKPFYDYSKKPYIPFEKNEELQKFVSAVAEQTSGTYKNISKAQAFMLRDPKNPKILKPTPISETYQSVIDEAVQSVTNGGIDYNTAIRRELKQLIESGLRKADYQAESGRYHSQRIDTAVRRNVLDGIRAVNQGVQDETGRQFGADGKEITVHEYPAPDHAPVQGHQFSNYEYDRMQVGDCFTDVKGNCFAGFQRAIGTLNCRHLAFSIIIGVFSTTYTDEELKEKLEKNEKGYTFPNGRHLTMYQCTQEQRRLETEIRRAKDGHMIAKEAGDMKLAEEYKAKVGKYTNQYKAFSAACGLTPKMQKTRVKSYGNKKAVDKSNESGIIKETNKSPITQITDKAIERVPNLKIQGYSDEQSKFIQQQHKELLTYARDKNSSNEAAFVFRNDLSDRKEFLGTDDKLDFGTSLTGMGDDIFVMHNHPRNGSYSDRDVRFLLEYDNVKALSIVMNNGGVELLIKTKDFNMNEAKVAFKRAYKKHVKNNTGMEIDKAIAEFLKKYKEGLEWIKK